ncbi:phosphatase PAP2 family protein [Streptomyces sp. NPDC049555]|uniref:phosphatase PAP2 family protein n=1 Tax=unclassified Streptomyces TaxID=2593676 RepID=UPI00341DC0B3
MNVQRLERRLTRRLASYDAAPVRRARTLVGEAAEHTRLWWAAAALIAATGAPRGVRAAGNGLLAMGAAEVAANTVVKPLWRRRRPPEELIPHDGVHDRPDSPSFPSGHTAAATAFTVAVARVWPRAGALCAVPAALVALERVHSGAHYPSDVVAGAALGAAAAWTARPAPWLRAALRARVRKALA